MTFIHGLKAMGVWSGPRGTNLLDSGAPFYDVYECADGRFVAVGALEPQFWAALVTGLGVEVEGDQHDPGTWPAQREAFTAAFLSRTRDEWAEHFEGIDACVAPVLSLSEAGSHPHLAARGTFAPGPDGQPVPRTPPRLSATPTLDPGPVPVPGADTTAWLRRLGFSGEELEGLLASGAVHQA
jgi:alpha-methylacyl-CoA racemase